MLRILTRSVSEGYTPGPSLTLRVSMTFFVAGVIKVMREKQYDDSTATDHRIDQLVARGELDAREGAHGDTLIEQ